MNPGIVVGLAGAVVALGLAGYAAIAGRRKNAMALVVFAAGAVGMVAAYPAPEYVTGLAIWAVVGAVIRALGFPVAGLFCVLSALCYPFETFGPHGWLVIVQTASDLLGSVALLSLGGGGVGFRSLDFRRWIDRGRHPRAGGRAAGRGAEMAHPAPDVAPRDVFVEAFDRR